MAGAMMDASKPGDLRRQVCVCVAGIDVGAWMCVQVEQAGRWPN